MNSRPRPLALYYFDDDRPRVDRVLNATTSGGATVNDVMQHIAQSQLPFGGVGPSGMGHYHGHHGFETFSKKKGVLFQSRFGVPAIVRPPYTAPLKLLIRALLRV